MSKTIISEGKTTAEAVENGLKELGVSKNKVDIKVIEEKKKSFFSILDPHVVKVELTLKDEEEPETREHKEKPALKVSEQEIEDAQKQVEDFLKEFLIKVSKNIQYKIKNTSEAIEVELTGEDASKLIGYRGETLNSVQTILSAVASKKKENPIKVLVDIENYRAKRKQTLEELAEKIERTVSKTGKKVTLEPMTPYERKIIHTKLQESESVKTYSIGENNNRRIVISKK